MFVVFICFDAEAHFVVCVCLNNLRVLDHVKCEDYWQYNLD